MWGKSSGHPVHQAAEEVEGVSGCGDMAAPPTRGRGATTPRLPPLPEEADLFTPPSPRRAQWVDLAGAVVGVLGEQAAGALVEVTALATQVEQDRKRVYECLNVMEGVGMVGRARQGVYRWRGAVAADTVARLLQLANQGGLEERLRSLCGGVAVEEVVERMTVGVITQKVVMVFLVVPVGSTVSLAVAAATVHGLEEGRKVTRVDQVRRICEVLCGVGILVRQVGVEEGEGGRRVAGYSYRGPEVGRGGTEGELRSAIGHILETDQQG